MSPDQPSGVDETTDTDGAPEESASAGDASGRAARREANPAQEA